MKKVTFKALAFSLCLIMTFAPLMSVDAFGEEITEYEYSTDSVFSIYSKVALATLYRTGIRTIGTISKILPNGIDGAVKLTLAPVEGNNSFSLSTCYISKPEADGFVSSPHAVPTISGKEFCPFEGREGEDSAGIMMYIGTGKDTAVVNASGKVKVQFGKASSKGLSEDESYASLDRGFIFESEEFTIDSNGYAFITYDGIKCVDSWTEDSEDFYNDYLPLVDAINVIITPSKTIESGDIYYINDVRFYRGKQEYGINIADGQAISGKKNIKIRTVSEGNMCIKLDDEVMPAYCGVTEYKDRFGYNVKSYDVDTLLVGDGAHNLKFVLNGNIVSERNVFFDNSLPYIAYSSISDGTTVSSYGTIDMIAADLISEVKSFEVSLDGEKIMLPRKYTFSDSGSHLISYKITDNADNVKKGFIHFNVGTEAILSASSKIKGSTAVFNLDTMNISGSSSAEFYTIDNSLDITAYTNVADISDMNDKIPNGEKETGSVGNIAVSSKDSKYPYISYDVDVSGVTEDTFKVSFSGAANTGESLVLSGYNVTESGWTEMARETFNSDRVVLSADVSTVDYNDNGTARFRVSILSVDNGSDTFAWCTDSQHEMRHIWEDGKPRDYSFYVKEQCEQMLSDYKANKINYVTNTGDIIDQSNDMSQWQEARLYNDILDQNNVPNGVLPGNHDTNWTAWATYFGPQYYSHQNWWGDTYDKNNSCHYDLVTIGGRDYIFLHIGWSMEQKDEVHKWARSILAKYSDRDCIVCTHGYLNIDNTHNVNYMNDTEALWRGVINQCPNVVMVLCGHEPGVANTTRITDDGRKVVEILHDYQSDSPAERWWIWNEGGWGLFRYVTIKDGKVINRTYTASQDHYNKDYYWDHDRENFEMDIMIGTNNRFVKGYSFAAYTGFGTNVGKAKQDNGKYYFELTDTNDGELWYASVNGNSTAVMPMVSISADVPVITSAAGVDGKLKIQWNPVKSSDVIGYSVFVDGEKTASLNFETTSFECDTGIKKGNKCRVSVSADTAVGYAMSLSEEVVFSGAADIIEGDVDCDGEINVKDALAALRVSLKCGTVTYDGWIAADINKDKNISIFDVTAILKMAVSAK